jgi:NADPH:quinone reductase
VRAAGCDTSGPERGALRVIEVPAPDPGPGEVCVRVAVSGVNPTDWKARERPEPAPRWRFQIVHHDGAGVISAVGPGVDARRVGERVWVYHAAHRRPGGTAAEYVVMPERQVVPLPDGVSMEQGAGLGIPGITAHRCLFADGPVEDRTVLVTGGAGAVGHAAIQLARWGGARVIATVSTEAKATIARDAGAHEVLRYTEPGLGGRLREVASGIDRVVDVALTDNLSHYLPLLNEHATVSCYARTGEDLLVPLPPLMLANVLLRFVLVYGLGEAALNHATTDITAALSAGALRPLPTHRFRLDDVEKAHEAVRNGVTGKAVIFLTDEPGRGGRMGVRAAHGGTKTPRPSRPPTGSSASSAV